MITLSDNKMLLNNGIQGKAHEAQSDMVIDATWGRNGSDKVAYIYDYFHDDQPDIAIGMTYSQYTTKTKIDIRYNLTTKAQLAKDQNESHIMFRPSVERKLSNTWPLDYYPTSFGKNAEFPVGCYIDIPDNRNVYRKWLICDRTFSESYVYYLVLPCNYRYTWVKDDTTYSMWGVARVQNSYNSQSCLKHDLLAAFGNIAVYPVGNAGTPLEPQYQNRKMKYAQMEWFEKFEDWVISRKGLNRTVLIGHRLKCRQGEVSRSDRHLKVKPMVNDMVSSIVKAIAS